MLNPDNFEDLIVHVNDKGEGHGFPDYDAAEREMKAEKRADLIRSVFPVILIAVAGYFMFFRRRRR